MVKEPVNKKRRSAWYEVVTTYVLAILIFIFALIIGPLPGPGGTFFILLSVHILSKENKTARRLEKYLIKKHNNLASILFRKNRFVQWGWDIFIYLVLLTGGYLIWRFENMHFLFEALTWSSMGYSVFFWFTNRQRWKRLVKWIKKTRRKLPQKQPEKQRQPPKKGVQKKSKKDLPP